MIQKKYQTKTVQNVDRKKNSREKNLRRRKEQIKGEEWRKMRELLLRDRAERRDF